MAQGFGSFDATYYGRTYTEDIEAIEKGLQQGMQMGANIRQAVARNEKQQADIRAQKQRELAAEMALNSIDKKVREGLILPAESSSDNLNDARTDFSNILVDKLNQLKIARDDGDITSADYQKAVQVLNAQIPAFKSAEKVIYTGVEQFLDGLENGTLSGSISAKDFQFWSSLARGEANVSYKVDDNGKILLDGTWKDVDGNDNPISAALAEMDRLPFVSTKPETNVKEQLAADAKNILDTKEGNTMRAINPKTGKYEEDIQTIYNKQDNSLTPWFKQFATESFDGYFNGLGRGDKRKALKEYLMDSVEIKDRRKLMDQLAGGNAESYGIDTLDKLLEGKSLTDINNFINSSEKYKGQGLKADWLEQSKNAVIEANKQIINNTNADTYKAQLELRKDIANTRKAEAQAGSAQLDYTEKTKNSGKPKGNSPELTQIYNQIMGTPAGGLSRDPRDLASGKDPYIARIQPALKSEGYFIDLDKEGNYLLGKAGMEDQKKKRVIDPSRIKDIGFLMKEIAALNNQTWTQPIIYK